MQLSWVENQTRHHSSQIKSSKYTATIQQLSIKTTQTHMDRAGIMGHCTQTKTQLKERSTLTKLMSNVAGLVNT